MRQIVLLTIVLIILSGCMSTQEWLAAKPQSYQDGYKSGCENGNDMASYSYVDKKNNTSIYRSDNTYRSGWDEGYADCYSDKEIEIMTKRSGRF